MTEFTIRTAVKEDLASLVRIYNFYIENTATTFDIELYTLESRSSWFDQFSSRGRHQLLVVEENGQVLGYACSGQFKAKQAYETSVEVSIYLDQNTQSRGLGTALYKALFKRLKKEDVHRAYAGITLPNEASLFIHKKFGFASTGVYREVGRKFGKYWDVEWLEKSLN